VRADVQAALGARGAPPEEPPGWELPPGSRAEPLSTLRRAIARRMAAAAREAPHFFVEIDVDAQAMLAARAAWRAQGGPAPAVGACVLRAVALALRDEPELNAWLQGEQLVRHEAVDLSVAMSVGTALLMPVLRQADRQDAHGIDRWLREMRARAETGPLPPGSSRGGGFAVSNLGGHGVRAFTAILQPPQVGILAVGEVQQRPVVRDGALAVGQQLTVTLSVDHRAVDGALAARWLQAFRRRIEDAQTWA
jgi:pyruvate dehydrogenase E2 component (dihydrolipoamide acetyltransferase)